MSRIYLLCLTERKKEEKKGKIFRGVHDQEEYYFKASF